MTDARDHPGSAKTCGVECSTDKGLKNDLDNVDDKCTDSAEMERQQHEGTSLNGLKETLRQQRAEHGNNGPSVVGALIELAKMVSIQSRTNDDIHEACALLEEASEIAIRGEHVCEYMNILEHLSKLYIKTDRFDDAAHLCERYRNAPTFAREALMVPGKREEYKLRLGVIALIMSELGDLCNRKGDKRQALTYLSIAVSTTNKCQGDTSADALLLLSRVARAHIDMIYVQDQPDQEELRIHLRWFERGVHVLRNKGTSFKIRGWFLAGCGIVSLHLGKVTAARNYLIEGMAVIREKYDLPLENMTMNKWVARAHGELGNWSEQGEVLLQGITCGELLFGRECVTVATLLSEYAQCLDKLARYDEAITALERALKIFVKAEGDKSANVGRTQAEIAGAKFDKGDEVGSLASARDACETLKAVPQYQDFLEKAEQIRVECSLTYQQRLQGYKHRIAIEKREGVRNSVQLARQYTGIGVLQEKMRDTIGACNMGQSRSRFLPGWACRIQRSTSISRRTV